MSEVQTEKKPRKAQDPELKAIKEIMERIDALDDDSQGRVISYLFQRYAGPSVEPVCVPQ